MPYASRFLHQTAFLHLSAHDQAWIADTSFFIRRGSFPTFHALSSIRTGTPSAFDSALAHLAVRPNNGCQDYHHNSRYLLSFTPSRSLGARFWPAHCLISGFPRMYSVHRRLRSRPFFRFQLQQCRSVFLLLRTLASASQAFVALSSQQFTLRTSFVER